MEAARRISEQFRQVDQKISDIHLLITDIQARRRTSMQEMEKNIREAFVAGRSAVEAEITAVDRITQERERVILAEISRVREDISNLQRSIADQIGPGRLSDIEARISELQKSSSQESAEGRQRRFTIAIAILTGMISLVVTLSALGITRLLTSVPSHRATPTEKPTVYQTCPTDPHLRTCFELPPHAP